MKNEFYNKANEYAIGRPTYPEEIIRKIKELDIGNHSTIADIGAGTGLLTYMLNKLDCMILAVEPNEEMLAECKNYCSTLTNIEYINAPAENTQIKDNSLDMILIAQAFHWFDKELSKVEFKRILKENGYIIFLWNDLQIHNEFASEYMNIIRKYTIKTTAAISNFDPDKEKYNFLGQECEKIYYNNTQSLDLEGIIGNASSLSYTPSKIDSNYVEFERELKNLFLNYQEEGQVTLYYKTEMCIGQFLK